MPLVLVDRRSGRAFVADSRARFTATYEDGAWRRGGAFAAIDIFENFEIPSDLAEAAALFREARAAS